AVAHGYLGNYERATALLEQALQKDDPWVQAYGAEGWAQLGAFLDLQGQRDRALQAYARCLREPDSWRPEGPSAHARAWKYTRRPYTEKDLLDGITPRKGRLARR